MTDTLIETLAEHAAGNYRVLCSMATELLATAAQKELPQIDSPIDYRDHTQHGFSDVAIVAHHHPAVVSIEPAGGSQADVLWELECLMLHPIGPSVRPYVTESSDPVSSSEAMESRYSAKFRKW